MILKIVLLCVLYFLCVNGDESKSSSSISGGYETKYDNIDLNQLLRNDRLRKNYVKCLLNEGPCTPDAQELKSNRKFTIHLTNIESVKFIQQEFFVRLSSRRHSYQLLQMHREAKKWFRDSDTLSN